MKKLMTKSAILLMAMTFAAAFTGCSKDDNNNNGSTEEQDDTAELSQIQEKQQAELMLNALCRYDEEKGVYTPRIGEAINAPTPTIYYTIANTADEARNRYEGIVSSVRTDSLDTSALPTDVKRGDVHLTFAPSTADGETARITVDCPRLKNVLTAIVFIPETAWPENDAATPFNFGSCWREKSTGRIYVCVQDCRGGSGIMLTLDGGWEDDWFRQYDHWQGQFYLYKNCASEDAFRGLSDYYKYSNNKLNSLNQKLQSSNYKNSATANYIYKFLSDAQYIYDYDFDISYTYDHHLWWGYNCWDVTIKSLYFRSNRDTQTWCRSYTHKGTPSKRNPSYSFYFNRSYDKGSNWEAIFY